MTTLDDHFAHAWQRYPRKEKKIAARDAYRWAMQNHNQDGELPDKILTAIAWQIEMQPEWKFWTTFDRWCLNQRWTDEKPVAKVDALRLSRELAPKPAWFDQQMQAAIDRQKGKAS